MQEMQKNITVNRAKAVKRQAENAAKMITDSNKKFKQCKIGDSVTLKVPDAYKGRGDFNNVMSRVVEIDYNGMLTLGTKHGILKGKYTRGEVTPCGESFISAESVLNTKTLPLRELARLESNGTGQGFWKCSCKKSCKTGRCKCKSNNVLCNSKCHLTRSTCENKSDD